MFFGVGACRLATVFRVAPSKPAASATTTDSDPKEMEHTIARLAPRWFVVRNVHAADAGPILVKPCNTWSMMRAWRSRKALPTFLCSPKERAEECVECGSRGLAAWRHTRRVRDDRE